MQRFEFLIRFLVSLLLGVLSSSVVLAEDLPDSVQVFDPGAINPENLNRNLQQLWELSMDNEAQGELQSAVSAMEVMVTLSGGRFSPPMMRLGYLHMRLENYKEALRYYTAADEIQSTLDSQQGRLNALMGLKKWPKALEVARAILAKNPDHYLTLLRLGHITFQLRQYDETVAAYNQILPIFPNDQEAQIGKAYALLAQGKHGQARPIFKHVLSKYPDDLSAQKGLQMARKIKWTVDAYYTVLSFSSTAVRTHGFETGIAPTLNYRDYLLVTPSVTYTEIGFGSFGTTYQPSVNLGLWASSTPYYALNLHFGQVYNNSTAANTTDQGVVAYAEVQRLGDLFVGLGGAYSDYHADRNIGVSQATLRIGCPLFPWLYMQTKGWYTQTDGPRVPTGPGFDQPAMAFEQQVKISPRRMELSVTGVIWRGRKQFPIEADGGQIWNLSDLLLGGYTAQIAYTFPKGQSVYFIYSVVDARPATVGGIEGRVYQSAASTLGWAMPLP